MSQNYDKKTKHFFLLLLKTKFVDKSSSLLCYQLLLFFVDIKYTCIPFVVKKIRKTNERTAEFFISCIFNNRLLLGAAYSPMHVKYKKRLKH